MQFIWNFITCFSLGCVLCAGLFYILWISSIKEFENLRQKRQLKERFDILPPSILEFVAEHYNTKLFDNYEVCHLICWHDKSQISTIQKLNKLEYFKEYISHPETNVIKIYGGLDIEKRESDPYEIDISIDQTFSDYETDEYWDNFYNELNKFITKNSGRLIIFSNDMELYEDSE